jgi:hypothetical protein
MLQDQRIDLTTNSNRPIPVSHRPTVNTNTLTTGRNRAGSLARFSTSVRQVSAGPSEQVNAQIDEMQALTILGT